MGIVVGGVFGGVKNKVGNVVFSNWKGRNTVRKQALSVANPRTTPQVNQRNKFKGASIFFSAILGVWVKPLWDRFSGNITGYNAIMKENTEVFDNDGNVQFVDLVMSKGKMTPVSEITVTGDASAGTASIGGTAPVDVTWGQNNEVVYGLLLDAVTGKPIASGQVVVDPSDVFSINFTGLDLTAGQEVAAFVAIKRADGTQVSNSTYAGGVVVA
jgi:hypothetical protein